VLGFLLEGVQHVDDPGEADSIDGAVRIAVEVIHDFEDASSAVSLERFRKRRLETLLRIPQRASDLAPLGLTATGAAGALGVSRRMLSAIINGRSGISPEMAVRLSLAFDTTAESWLAQQLQYDLWQAEKKRASLRSSASRLLSQLASPSR
jgi:addiction module HigA family antidote